MASYDRRQANDEPRDTPTQWVLSQAGGNIEEAENLLDKAHRDLRDLHAELVDLERSWDYDEEEPGRDATGERLVALAKAVQKAEVALDYVTKGMKVVVRETDAAVQLARAKR